MPYRAGKPRAQDATKDRPRRLNPIKQKQMEERCAFLEEEVPRIEASIAHTEEQLGVYVSAAETQRLTTLAEDLRAQLDAFTAEWEELMLQLEGWLITLRIPGPKGGTWGTRIIRNSG